MDRRKDGVHATIFVISRQLLMDLIQNRRAFHDYEILETYEAGIVLQGTEVKSLRDHGGNLAESYVKISGEEAWLIGSSIAPYRHGGVYNHEEKRERKLLLHKREIQKLKEGSQQKGLTILALALYLKAGRVKVKLALAKGKKAHDKRQALIAREKKKEIDRALKKYR